jgi:DNA-binding MarR family transcriptional regulator
MYLRPPTVVGILDRLEQRGQVARTRSAEDQRVVTVTLTAKGKKTVSKVPQVAQGLLLTGLKTLDNGELEAVSEGLERLVGILGARQIPPQLLFSQEVNAPAPAERGKPRLRTGARTP